MRNIQPKIFSSVILFCLIGLNTLLAQDSNSAKAIGPRIKGFAIGMSLDEAKEIVQRMAPNAKLKEDNEYNTLFLRCEEDAGGFALTKLPVSISADLKRSVKSIRFTDTNAVFNTSGMYPEDFAKEVLKAFNLPKLEYYRRGAGPSLNSGWEYTSEDGWQIEILERDKSLILRAFKVAKPNFN